jgi:Calcineurin-like phosphoesterase
VSRRAKLAVAAVAAAALATGAVVVADRGDEAGDRSAAPGRDANGAAAGQPRALLWAIGDGADGSARSRRLFAQVLRERPDRFLYLGDVYPLGTARDFRRSYHAVYGRLARITDPTPGNHEWGDRRQGYQPYWRRVKGRRQLDWYGYRLAGWEVLNLNSEAPHGPGSRQLRWLRARLRAGPGGDCRLAFWHRPRYSAGLVHADAPDMAPLWDALSGRAWLVLNGHQHSLQRMRRLDGITQYVVGAGGRSLYPLRAGDPRLAFGADDRDGALRIELSPGRATVELRDASGRTLDRSRVRCRRRG